MIRAAVIGATGYTGMELVRLLLGHPQVDLVATCSRKQAGTSLQEAFPNLIGETDIKFTEKLSVHCDVVFFAAPNGVAMHEAESLLKQNTKIIDLAADFRLKDSVLWEKWYGIPHACPQLLEQAVYGLPEIYRQQIKQAQLLANPGCYPTSILLGFYPLLKASAIDGSYLIADAKSGISGAGRIADINLNMAEMDGNFKSYKASAHRHFPEIKAHLDKLSGQSVEFSFTPHLLPIVRGIFSTLYFNTELQQKELQAIFDETYKKEPFVFVLPPDTHPETRYVRGVNNCHIAVHKPEASNIGKVLVVIDNLVKGAAGQAIQNMNIMFGIAETDGLDANSILP